MAAAVIFQGLVNATTVRVVDKGVGITPRLTVEAQLPPDAMGAQGWGAQAFLDMATFSQLMLAAGVVH